MFVIFLCYECGKLLIAKNHQSTKLCFYCGSCLKLSKIKKVANARTAQEASQLIRNLKRKKHLIF